MYDLVKNNINLRISKSEKVNVYKNERETASVLKLE